MEAIKTVLLLRSEAMTSPLALSRIMASFLTSPVETGGMVVAMAAMAVSSRLACLSTVLQAVCHSVSAVITNKNTGHGLMPMTTVEMEITGHEKV